MITTIIFDFFDVLCPDDYKAWLARNGYKKEGKFLTVSEQLDHGEISTDEFFDRLGELSGQAVADLRASFIADPLIDREVLRTVKDLRKHHKVALLSNAPSQFLRDILAKLELEQHFDAIFISSEVGHIKPSKEIFEHALEKLQSSPSETIFVDDNPHYVAGARRVGLHGIIFADATQLRSDLKKAGASIGAS